MTSQLTPMMKQYLEIKQNHPNEILFFRLGDFYEMFMEDAEVASKILGIALTSRQNNIPMCGIPYFSKDTYIARLIKAGKNIAICEQMESQPSSGSIVKRQVTKIITPGTLVESHLLQSDDNNFLASVLISPNEIHFSFIDVSTGDFYISSINESIELFRGEIARYSPKEIVYKSHLDADKDEYLNFLISKGISVCHIQSYLYEIDYMKKIITDVFKTAGTSGLGLTNNLEILSAGSALQYLHNTQKQTIEHIKNPQKLTISNRMFLDETTIESLELIENLQDRSKERTLFSVLNLTKTAMGRRILEWNILQPLICKSEIETRLNYVDSLFLSNSIISDIQLQLKKISDLERIIGRLVLGKTHPKTFLSISESIRAVNEIRKILLQKDLPVLSVFENIETLIETADMIDSTISEDPAASPEEGRVIKEGHSEELDRLYNIKDDSQKWIIDYQEEEKKKLGIPSLKIKYNRVLGYYIETTKLQAVNIKDGYYRKQSLVGAERFTSDRLQELETEILSASDKIIALENKEINNLKSALLQRQKEIQQLASAIGLIDFYQSLAVCALENGFIRPHFSDDDITEIIDARHPVVEKYYTKEVFIPNDIHLDSTENIIQIITGPNMSGKSTYIRMCALLQLMAQIGSFIPASKAVLSITDRIFTRIGASDNISRGESTFLVEMNETANILNHATPKSLLIMDEIGRGTSTYDGLSIAWAVVEYILRYIKAKTMFATHYHELTVLGKNSGIVNYNVLVSESFHNIEFLHKLVPGSASKSYGIHVAKLAGIPKQVISRATTILEKHEKNQNKAISADENSQSLEQLEIFNASNHILVQNLKNIDIDSITPIEALNELQKLKKLVD